MDSDTGPSTSKKRKFSGSPRLSADGDYKSLFDKGVDEVFASNFKREDLDSLRVFYDRDPMAIDDFFEMVKEKNNRSRWRSPEIAKLFVKMTKDNLKFDFSLDDLLKMRESPAYIRGAKPYIYEREMSSELNHHITKFQEFQLEELQQKLHAACSATDKFYVKLFLFWSSKVVDFLFHCKDLIQKLNFPPPEFSPYAIDKRDDGKKSESIFVETFRKFSEVYFLLPTNHRKTYGILKNVPVSSEPDVTFLETSNLNVVTPTVAMACEVKRHATISQDDKGTWIEKRLSSDSMGQLGAELLSECNVSTFSPNVLGIACMRTEIIFMFLEITDEHIVDVVNDNDSLDERRASIHYTKKYDIMKTEDRDEFIEMLFYIGCMQKGDLHMYFLSKQ